MQNAAMDLQARRALLRTAANPDARLDYVVSLEGSFSPPGMPGPVAVGLRYVPDREVLDRNAFGRYLDGLAAVTWPSIEALAVTLRDDINNEVVARWLQVTVSAPAADDGPDRHEVMLEDRQPTWDNPVLLSRLRLI